MPVPGVGYLLTAVAGAEILFYLKRRRAGRKARSKRRPCSATVVAHGCAALEPAVQQHMLPQIQQEKAPAQPNSPPILDSGVSEASGVGSSAMTLDSETIQALEDPQQAARMYHRLLVERDLLAHQMAGLQQQDVSIRASSSVDSLLEGLGQLRQLAAAAGQEVADILSSTSSSAAGSASLASLASRSHEAANTDSHAGVTAAPTNLPTVLLNRAGAQGGTRLSSWGSGFSDAGAGSQPGSPLMVRSAPSAADDTNSNDSATNNNWQQSAAAIAGSMLLQGFNVDALELAAWGSGAWASRSGGSSLRSTVSGGPDMAALRADRGLQPTSRLAVSSNVMPHESSALQEWGSGIPSRRTGSSDDDRHAAVSSAAAQQDTQREQQLAAALLQVQQLHWEREQLEQLCQHLQQQVEQLQQFAFHQEQKLALSDEIIGRMQALAQTLSTLRVPGSQATSTGGMSNVRTY